MNVLRLGSVGFQGSNPIKSDLWQSFEAGSDNDPINAAYLNANDVGTPPNPWTTVGTIPIVSTEQVHKLIRPVQVAGINYFDTNGTRSCEFTHASLGFAEFQWSSGYPTDLICAAWWKSTMPLPNFGNYDLLVMEHLFSGLSEFAVFQQQNNTVRAHTSLGAGANIIITNNTWYWIVLRAQTGIGATLYVYSDTGALVGTSTLGYGANPNGVRYVQVGNVNPHSSFPSGSAFFDNCVFIWTSPTVPLPP